ncbi:hypothetical protein PTSG_02643 [Salpingoeca rosetta]|uniref:EF-hand domain-containing protein n=1 Tax=Salpingoeca rosetta (strain ATCC 50818 / BSB-021) TaxID=946362 RepID=F2U2W4_SALR5|nr:uncharacterized protein PTSG_02643 [Salpingoeca rosetta]EGD81958.1 hypothetical protein PTSG_02643 [Salpingoeca rosetta]|eukprot:XP_004996141.1 hypothetical protein PTSG_02643 [Salpingoeca rosetta]
MPRDTHTLTPAQKAAFKEVFGFFDLNKGGTITQGELYTRARQLGLTIEEWEVHEAMNEIDPQHLGHVSFEAFLNYMTSNQKYSETLTANKPASAKVPKEALLFVAVTKFVQCHKHSSIGSKKARHMAELERYYRNKAKHHPHVIGDFAAGWRLVGLTQREFQKHWIDLKSENKAAGKASSSPYAQAPSMRLFVNTTPNEHKRSGSRGSSRKRRGKRSRLKHKSKQQQEQQQQQQDEGRDDGGGGNSGSGRTGQPVVIVVDSDGNTSDVAEASRGAVGVPTICMTECDDEGGDGDDGGTDSAGTGANTSGKPHNQQQRGDATKHDNNNNSNDCSRGGGSRISLNVDECTAVLLTANRIGNNNDGGGGNCQDSCASQSPNSHPGMDPATNSDDIGAADTNTTPDSEATPTNTSSSSSSSSSSSTSPPSPPSRARGRSSLAAKTSHLSIASLGSIVSDSRRSSLASRQSSMLPPPGPPHHQHHQQLQHLQHHPQHLSVSDVPPRPPPWTTVSQDPQQKQLHRSRYHRRSYCLPHVPMRGGRRGPGAPPLKFTDLPEIRRKADEAKKSFLHGQSRKGETLLNEQWRKTRADTIASPMLKRRLRRTFQAYTGTATKRHPHK